MALATEQHDLQTDARKDFISGNTFDYLTRPEVRYTQRRNANKIPLTLVDQDSLVSPVDQLRYYLVYPDTLLPRLYPTTEQYPDKPLGNLGIRPDQVTQTLLERSGELPETVSLEARACLLVDRLLKRHPLSISVRREMPWTFDHTPIQTLARNVYGGNGLYEVYSIWNDALDQNLAMTYSQAVAEYQRRHQPVSST